MSACSIALCTYNGAHYLPAQLDSLLAQTRLPDEIVLSDDGSTDGTIALLHAFAVRAGAMGIDCRVMARQSPLGPNGNFESACKQCHHPVVFLCDQDDVWDPGKIETQLKVFSEDSLIMLVSSDARIIQADDKRDGTTLFERIASTRRERAALQSGDLSIVGAYKNLFTGATIAFRRTLLEVALPFPDSVQHDEWLAQIAWLRGEVRTLFAPLVDYRLHSGNHTGLPDAKLRGNTSASGRLRHFLTEQARRLEPVAQRIVQAEFPSGRYPDRARLRLGQYSFCLERAGYPRHFLSRLTQVSKTFHAGRYSLGLDPVRTAVLDLFRCANS